MFNGVIGSDIGWICWESSKMSWYSFSCGKRGELENDSFICRSGRSCSSNEFNHGCKEVLKVVVVE